MCTLCALHICSWAWTGTNCNTKLTDTLHICNAFKSSWTYVSSFWPNLPYACIAGVIQYLHVGDCHELLKGQILLGTGQAHLCEIKY